MSRPVGGTGHWGPPQAGVCPHHAQKTTLNPGQPQHWVIPPLANAAFVCAREDALEVDTRLYAPQRPQVCVDETRHQLVAETREPIPAPPGPPERVDDEDERQGTAKRLMGFEPWAGRRRVTVTARRTAVDSAPLLREVSDQHAPHAETIVLAMDNLKTHELASLEEAFAPTAARRFMERFAVHDTPKHGSWLKMAETDLGGLAPQGLERRIPDPTPLTREVAAWERQRKTAQCRGDWRFTTQDARITLQHLYPSIQLG